MTSGQTDYAKNNESFISNVKWQPFPGLQALAVDTRADQTLYCGTRACGKTAAQLMCFRQYVGVGHGAKHRGIIFDTEYKPLEDIKAQAKKFFLNMGDGCRWLENKYYFEWKTGEKLYLRAAKNADDARNYLGHEYTFIGFNELSKWNNSEVYDMMLGTIRVGELVDSGIRRLVFSTTNPYGPGTVWIYNRFKPDMPGFMMTEEYEVPTFSGQMERIVKTKVVISGNYRQNPYIKPADIANLFDSVRDSPEREAAWLYCNWKAAFVDGALGDIWDAKVHIIPNFTIPANWKVNRAFDWGSTTPFAVGWFAESNGEEVITEDGQKLTFPLGTVIMFYEWYGSWRNRTGINRGCRMTPAQVARGIKTREHDFVPAGVMHKGHRVRPGPADNQISNVTRTDIETIKATMARFGVKWTESDKSPGSRSNGLHAIRQALRHSVEKEGRGLYFMRRCRAAIDTLPNLEKDGEDIAKDQEDHIYDMLRYRMLIKKMGKPNVNISIY